MMSSSSDISIMFDEKDGVIKLFSLFALTEVKSKEKYSLDSDGVRTNACNTPLEDRPSLNC